MERDVFSYHFTNSTFHCRGIPRIWQGGGARIFFSDLKFACRFAWCNLMYVLIRFYLKKITIFYIKTAIFYIKE